MTLFDLYQPEIYFCSCELCSGGLYRTLKGGWWRKCIWWRNRRKYMEGTKRGNGKLRGKIYVEIEKERRE